MLKFPNAYGHSGCRLKITHVKGDQNCTYWNRKQSKRYTISRWIMLACKVEWNHRSSGYIRRKVAKHFAWKIKDAKANAQTAIAPMFELSQEGSTIKISLSNTKWSVVHGQSWTRTEGICIWSLLTIGKLLDLSKIYSVTSPIQLISHLLIRSLSISKEICFWKSLRERFLENVLLTYLSSYRS